MIIAIDTSPLTTTHQGRGVGTYTKNLIDTLKKTKSDFTFIYTPNPASTKADLIHYPYFDFFSHTLTVLKPTKTVVTIFDVIPLIYPQHFPIGIKGQANFLLQKQALKTVSAVLTDSQSAKNDIPKFLKIDPKKIFVTYLAASQEFKKQPASKVKKLKQKYHLPDKFITYVGDINYNKNLPGLISAFKDAKDCHLVITTRADLNQDIPEVSAIKSALNKHQLSKKTTFIQVDSTEELATLYSASFWYIQPSLYEGFGLPVLEAMQSGTPVLCSKTSSLPEVAGDAALYFNPKSTSSITSTIKKALSLSDAKRSQLIAKGKTQAKKFSWHKTVTETLNIYKTVLS